MPNARRVACQCKDNPSIILNCSQDQSYHDHHPACNTLPCATTACNAHLRRTMRLYGVPCAASPTLFPPTVSPRPSAPQLLLLLFLVAAAVLSLPPFPAPHMSFSPTGEDKKFFGTLTVKGFFFFYLFSTLHSSTPLLHLSSLFLSAFILLMYT